MTTGPYLTEDEIAKAMLDIDDPLAWQMIPHSDAAVNLLLQFARALERAVQRKALA